jgi:hypothetical protein
MFALSTCPTAGPAPPFPPPRLLGGEAAWHGDGADHKSAFEKVMMSVAVEPSA